MKTKKGTEETNEKVEKNRKKRTHVTLSRYSIKGTHSIDKMTREDAKIIGQSIDDEGSIAVSGKSIIVNITGQRSPKIAVAFAEKYGGLIYDGDVKGKPFYRYMACERDVQRKLLNKLLQFDALKIKKGKALLALKVFDVCDHKLDGWKQKRDEILAAIKAKTGIYERVDVSELKGVMEAEAERRRKSKKLNSRNPTSKNLE